MYEVLFPLTTLRTNRLAQALLFIGIAAYIGGIIYEGQTRAILLIAGAPCIFAALAFRIMTRWEN